MKYKIEDKEYNVVAEIATVGETDGAVYKLNKIRFNEKDGTQVYELCEYAKRGNSLENGDGITILNMKDLSDMYTLLASAKTKKSRANDSEELIGTFGERGGFLTRVLLIHRRGNPVYAFESALSSRLGGMTCSRFEFPRKESGNLLRQVEAAMMSQALAA